MNENIAVVFNGFLALSMKEKIKLVDIMNEFFDYPDRREAIRKDNQDAVKQFFATTNVACVCCRR